MLMGNNHACPVLQSGTADTNDLLQGQRSLFLGSKVLTLSSGDSAIVFGFFNFTGDREGILYSVSSEMCVQLRPGIIAGNV